MRPNWRLGFRRVARVTAIAYWLIAAVFLSGQAWNASRVEATTFNVQLDGKNYVAVAFDFREAEAKAKAYEVKHFPTTASLLFGPEASQQFIAVDVPWDPMPAPRWNPDLGARVLGRNLVYWLVVYVVSWAIFRAIRWVVAGFAAPSDRTPTEA